MAEQLIKLPIENDIFNFFFDYEKQKLICRAKAVTQYRFQTDEQGLEIINNFKFETQSEAHFNVETLRAVLHLIEQIKN